MCRKLAGRFSEAAVWGVKVWLGQVVCFRLFYCWCSYSKRVRLSEFIFGIIWRNRLMVGTTSISEIDIPLLYSHGYKASINA